MPYREYMNKNEIQERVIVIVFVSILLEKKRVVGTPFAPIRAVLPVR